MTRPAHIVLGATIEYNDTNFDLYPSMDVLGVFWGPEEALSCRSSAAEALVEGWVLEEVSEYCLEDGESLVEAARRHIRTVPIEVPVDERGEVREHTFALMGLGVPPEGSAEPGPFTCLGVAVGDAVLDLAARKCREVLEAVRALNPQREEWAVDGCEDVLYAYELNGVVR